MKSPTPSRIGTRRSPIDQGESVCGASSPRCTESTHATIIESVNKRPLTDRIGRLIQTVPSTVNRGAHAHSFAGNAFGSLESSPEQDEAVVHGATEAATARMAPKKSRDTEAPRLFEVALTTPSWNQLQSWLKRWERLRDVVA